MQLKDANELFDIKAEEIEIFVMLKKRFKKMDLTRKPKLSGILKVQKSNKSYDYLPKNIRPSTPSFLNQKLIDSDGSKEFE